MSARRAAWGSWRRHLQLALKLGLLWSSSAAWAAGNGLLGPDFLEGFVDDLGHVIHPRELSRPLRLVAFGYTSCPDVCPLTLAALHQALIRLGPDAARIDPVFVSVDPDRDILSRLHSYVSAFDPRIRAYRGDESRLRALADGLQVSYWREASGTDRNSYAVDHTSTLFLLSRDGRVLARIYHYADPVVLSQAIAEAVKKSGG